MSARPDLVPFDRNWAGPEELKPRCYRSQAEKDTWYSCVVDNEYRLPPLVADDVVIDIGAHIGSFSYAAYRMGSRSIYAFEIDPWHIEGAQKNLNGILQGQPDEAIALYHCAVVRGDEHRAPVYKYAGNWTSFSPIGDEVESRSLDEILEPHDTVRFIKTDCEGGEWPILYTCTQLERVEQIAGEYHIIDPSAPELQNLPYPISLTGLGLFLYDQGFSVEFVELAESTGLFFAKKRA